MQTIEFNGHTIELQDSIQELPIARFMDLQRHLLAASNIGSTAEDIDLRISRIIGYIRKSENDKAETEVQNLRLSMRNAVGKLSPSMNAFCVLVESVDGVQVTDHGEAGLKRIMLQINTTKLTWGSAMKWLMSAKKKSKMKWGPFSVRPAI